MSYRDIVLGIRTERSVVGQVTKMEYKDRECLNMVISNLICCVDNNEILLYSRMNERADKWKHNPKGISNYRVKQAIDWLEQEGYAFNTIASKYQLYSDTRHTSYVMASDKFAKTFHTKEREATAKQAYVDSMPVVILRDKDGSDIVYRDSKDIRGIETLMRSMNNNNSQFCVEDENGQTINTLYKRLFKEVWTLNGRMYSPGVMNVENRASKGRLKFTINKMSSTECDFNCLHARLMADLYGWTVPEGDVYLNILPTEKHTPENRNLMKGAVNRILNCGSHKKATASVKKWMLDDAVAGHTFKSAATIVKLVHDFLGPIRQHLYKDRLGLRLANLESDIMSDIVQVFVLLNRPCLPVHDSAIVLREDQELLAKTMADCYRKHLNVDRKVILKYNMWIDGKEVKQDCSC